MERLNDAYRFLIYTILNPIRFLYYFFVAKFTSSTLMYFKITDNETGSLHNINNTYNTLATVNETVNQNRDVTPLHLTKLGFSKLDADLVSVWNDWLIPSEEVNRAFIITDTVGMISHLYYAKQWVLEFSRFRNARGLMNRDLMILYMPSFLLNFLLRNYKSVCLPSNSLLTPQDYNAESRIEALSAENDNLG